jgi:hypothetical protein
MKRVTLLFSIIALFLVSSAFAQTLQDVVSEMRGDTLVLKDDIDYGALNTLYIALNADSTNVPADRVYMLHKDGYYSLINNPATPTDRKIVIVGEDSHLLKTNTSTDFPPIITGAVQTSGNTTGGMTDNYNLVVKNCDIEPGNLAGDIGWGWFGFAANAKLTVDNCIMEHNYWIFMQPGSNVDISLTNDYFVNMAGFTCRRNGGIMDIFNPVDSIVVENCTHINAQGSMYKTRNNPINRIIFNHNDFIDCAGHTFMSLGYQTGVSMTNNIFINTDLQAWSGNINMDPGESDMGGEPMGLVNEEYPDTTGVPADSMFYYVDKNLAYWSPTLTDPDTGIVATINANATNGRTNWTSNMITMNTRTQGFFDDNTTYPYLTEGTWFNEMPSFTNSSTLFTDELQNVKTYAINAADTSWATALPLWRVVNTPASTNWTYADWPIPVDLSYSNSDLMTGGLGGMPVGDLNWFPTQYQSWMAQRTQEYATIDNATFHGITAIRSQANLPNKFQLSQNYPNPFNPSTVISYSIPAGANVTLKVYDVLGREVATLVNGFQNANTYKVNFNASSLSSGVYIYKLEAGSLTMSKKMLLLK